MRGLDPIWMRGSHEAVESGSLRVCEMRFQQDADAAGKPLLGIFMDPRSWEHVLTLFERMNQSENCAECAVNVEAIVRLFIANGWPCNSVEVPGKGWRLAITPCDAD